MKKSFCNLAFVSIALILMVLGCAAPQNTNVSTQPKNNLTPKAEEASKPDVTFDIVERWQIPNGGEGKRIVIPTNFQTESGLFLICDKIEQDIKNDRNAIVLGHKDAKSADIQKRMGKTTDKEEDYLGKNFILSFNKNGNTGFHRCSIYPNGVDDDKSQKTKEY